MQETAFKAKSGIYNTIITEAIFMGGLSGGTSPMRMTQFSNYAIRMLIYAGLNGHRPSGVPDIARAYGISQNHLNKVAAELCHLGYLQARRGRSGGVSLGRDPEQINIGEIIRQTESTVSLVECFDEKTNTCPLRPQCKFRIALQKALEAFFAELDRHSLADFIKDSEGLENCFGQNKP